MYRFLIYIYLENLLSMFIPFFNQSFIILSCFLHKIKIKTIIHLHFLKENNFLLLSYFK